MGTTTKESRLSVRMRVRTNAIEMFVTIVAMATAAVTVAVARIEMNLDHHGVNWVAFGVFAVLLIIAETKPSFSLRFGEGGEITPGWGFAFALVLLGSPLLAIIVSGMATLLADLTVRKSFIKILFNVSQVSLSLGLGALVLHLSGLSGPALSSENISFLQSLGMIGAGFTVLVTSALLLCIVMSLSRGVNLKVPIREGWVTSVTADGALLAVAPIFVIAVDYSMLLLPMLGVTSFIVFTSARQAIRQTHAATHDPLTQLRNRVGFHQSLQQRLSSGDSEDQHQGDRADQRRCVLLLIDLDRFKEVNDRLGHATGDALLAAFASRMERVIPDEAISARLGGDEFAILLEGCASADQELSRARDLRARLSQTLNVNGVPLSIDMSVGVAFAPDHARTADELLSCADVAMYRAKRKHSGVEIYGAIGEAREHGRISLLGALSDAIMGDQLTLAYQPQVRIGSGQCDMVEALLRWQHPTLGAVAPGDFVALAEHTELIMPLTKFVLERAIADLVSLDSPRISVAINVSARNLQDRHFPDLVLQTLRDNQLAPNRLELEITESAIATEPERSRYAIDALRKEGVRIAIDDFGTGYSSFLSLRDLEVDRLKIDRSFIGQVTSSAKDEILVRSIIGLAAELGLETVAEGIETIDTWDLVRVLGCGVGQGFVIARPLTFANLKAWLSRREALTELTDFELRTLVG